MVRSGRSAGLTPAPWAAASPGLASEETAAADAPRNPRRELVFDIVTSLGLRQRLPAAKAQYYTVGLLVYSVRPYIVLSTAASTSLYFPTPPPRQLRMAGRHGGADTIAAHGTCSIPADVSEPP